MTITTYPNFDDAGFWRKVRRFAGKIPFVPDAIAMYYAMIDPKTPAPAKVTIAGALLYFVCPVDAIPDMAPLGLGFTDDAAVVAAALAAVDGSVRNKHYRQAEEFLS